jgi:hypothetical protein
MGRGRYRPLNPVGLIDDYHSSAVMLARIKVEVERRPHTRLQALENLTPGTGRCYSPRS